MRKVLIFDMDGTIADLYGVDGWLEMLRAENPMPYEIAEPMVDMNKLSTVLNELAVLGWTIAITSWLSMNSTQAYKNAVRKESGLLKQGCRLRKYISFSMEHQNKNALKAIFKSCLTIRLM